MAGAGGSNRKEFTQQSTRVVRFHVNARIDARIWQACLPARSEVLPPPPPPPILPPLVHHRYYYKKYTYYEAYGGTAYLPQGS